MNRLVKKINYWLEANSGYGSPEAVSLLEEAIKEIKQLQTRNNGLKYILEDIKMQVLLLMPDKPSRKRLLDMIAQALKD